MESLLYNLIEHIGRNMPELMTVDEDYGQLEMLDDQSRESYPLTFPAVLIDSPETLWENVGQLNQKGLCTVNVRLIIDCYDDTHYMSGQTEKILAREHKRRELHRAGVPDCHFLRVQGDDRHLERLPLPVRLQILGVCDSEPRLFRISR